MFKNLLLKLFKVGEEQKGNTAGLCGTYDRDHTNDFKRRDGKLSKHINDFAHSWAVGGENKSI